MKTVGGRHRGFTLIELVMVIVLVGILASIALPKMIGMVDTAQVAAGKADLATLREAAGIYNSNECSTASCAFPPDKATLEAQLSTPMGSITSAHYSYDPSTGTVTCSSSAHCGS